MTENPQELQESLCWKFYKIEIFMEYVLLLQDILVVYFLGTGGLLRAYQEATIKGIENAGIAELRLGYKTSWSINYDEYGKFNFLCEKLGVYKIDTQYLDKIKILLVIPISEFETFKFKVLEESSGKIKPTEMEKVNFVLIDKKVVLV